MNQQYLPYAGNLPVSRGTGAMDPFWQNTERTIYGSRVAPPALPSPAAGAASRMAPANGLPLATRAAGAAGLMMYSPDVGTGSDRPPATPAPGFTPAPATPIPGAQGLPQVGPGAGKSGTVNPYGPMPSSANFAQPMNTASTHPRETVNMSNDWLTQAQGGLASVWNAMTGNNPVAQSPGQFRPGAAPIPAGASAQGGGFWDNFRTMLNNAFTARNGGAPQAAGASQDITSLLHSPNTLPYSPTNVGPTTVDAGTGQLPQAGPTASIEWSGNPASRQTYTPDQIASLANRNVVPGLPAPASQAPAQGPQQFDLGALMQMALNKGPGSANETFAQRGERKANKALASHLLGQVMGEQGQNWRAMLGEQGQNARTDKTTAMSLLAALMKPTELQFKTYSTKTPDGMGGYLQQDHPLIFDPSSGASQLLPGAEAQTPAPNGLHPALAQPYEANAAMWDEFAKRQGFKDGRTVYDEYVKAQKG